MQISSLYRHPIKSIGAERLSEVALTAGSAMPGDRLYAVAHGASAWSPDAPQWQSCGNFLRITHVPALAAVRLRFDPGEQRIALSHPQAEDLDADLREEQGRSALTDWLAPLASEIRPGPYRLAVGPDLVFTDNPSKTVSIMSMASLRALGQKMGVELDPVRFRGNLWLDGPGMWPFEELDWIGKTLAIGNVRLKVIEPIGRCAATAANPETGRRDCHPDRALAQFYGHTDFGVLAEVIDGGNVGEASTANIHA